MFQFNRLQRSFYYYYHPKHFTKLFTEITPTYQPRFQQVEHLFPISDQANWITPGILGTVNFPVTWPFRATWIVRLLRPERHPGWRMEDGWWIRGRGWWLLLLLSWSLLLLSLLLLSLSSLSSHIITIIVVMNSNITLSCFLFWNPQQHPPPPPSNMWHGRPHL